ncbi:MAG TPA: amidohydrolase [Candidatus Angelobacter sp.]|nr:amidohydrolase [Candidatus Angelobacter sp.]
MKTRGNRIGRDKSPGPDLILHNGKIYPDAGSRTHFEALAVREGRVSQVGSDRHIVRLKSAPTRKINLHRRTVLPGFHDSHIHLLNYGMLLRTLDLSSSRSIEQIRTRVMKRTSAESKGTWVLGRGWDHEKLREHRYPTREDLVGTSSKPVFLKRICGHVAVANSAALSIAGIDNRTSNPAGGEIVRDSKGNPNGVLKETAIELVENKIPEPMDLTRKALFSASRKLARLGLVSLHCIVSNLTELSALRDLKREKKIPQSIYPIIPPKLLDSLAASGQPEEKSESTFRVRGLKLYLDGSLGARTAALNEPYDDDPTSCGILTLSNEELTRLASKARESKFQLCIHAIGDKAVDLAVQVLGDTFGPEGCRQLRHRIEHSSIVSGDSMKEMRRLGIIASVQPRFVYSDQWASERLGAGRLPQLYPFASMNNAGIMLTAGSDCPVEDPNPFEGIWSAVARPGLIKNERLTVSESLVAYTKNPAYASFSEGFRGTLSPGYAADMVVLDGDPYESNIESLRKMRVLSTIISGRVVS